MTLPKITFLLIVHFLLAKCAEWDSAEEIQRLINKSNAYVLPTNNNAFFSGHGSGSTKHIDFGTFDFIIVGAGSAGGVLANRLTESKNVTVLLIEAGEEDSPISQILGLGTFLHNSPWNWGYNTTRQKRACLAVKNQQCFFPRGKSLGGTDAISDGLYVRGNAKDINKWAELGNKGWSYKECLPYFKKSEKAQFSIGIDKDYHGFYGPQDISVPEDTPDLTTTLLRGFEELGLQYGDYNGKYQLATSRFQCYLDFNIHTTTAHSFIRPAQDRCNLKISLESLVTKVNVSPGNKKKANGVEFIRNGQYYYASAKREVILSAGAINSPQILLLSGIGPAKELNRHGIKIVTELPVGENLVDHVIYTTNYRTNLTFKSYTLEESLDLWRLGKGPFNHGTGSQIAGFWSYKEDDQPDVEFLASMTGNDQAKSMHLNEEYTKAFSIINGSTDIAVTLALLHPKSVGKVTLKSNDPRDFPLIDPNFYADPSDIETMYKGILTILKLNETETFRNWQAQFLNVPMPGCDDKYKHMSKGWWICSLRHLTVTEYHPIGTTKMGTNASTSVVDNKLKVHGIENLRVIDAGIMPSHVSGHTNAITVMIAEKAADIIKQDHSI